MSPTIKYFKREQWCESLAKLVWGLNNSRKKRMSERGNENQNEKT